jgi:D-alanyl-lipoteichoic acid acyltransferase DltB (MBOAT superfamily)
MLFCGFVLFGIGIFGYIFYPLTMISKKSDLFILVFMIILIGMLLGLIFLGLNIEFVIEYIIINFIFILEDRWHRMILHKNIFKDRVYM